MKDAFQYAKKDIIEKANTVYVTELEKVKRGMQDACLTQHKVAEEARTRELEKWLGFPSNPIVDLLTNSLKEN